MNAPPFPSEPPVTLGDDGCWHIDVRGLAPPQPLVAILAPHRCARPRRPAAGGAPRPATALLYPELAERGWRAEPIAGEPGEVRLLLQPW